VVRDGTIRPSAQKSKRYMVPPGPSCMAFNGLKRNVETSTRQACQLLPYFFPRELGTDFLVVRPVRQYVQVGVGLVDGGSACHGDPFSSSAYQQSIIMRSGGPAIDLYQSVAM